MANHAAFFVCLSNSCYHCPVFEFGGNNDWMGKAAAGANPAAETFERMSLKTGSVGMIVGNPHSAWDAADKISVRLTKKPGCRVNRITGKYIDV